MKTCYDPQRKQWNRSTSARVPKHDLFFGTPQNKPTAGIPIGDGDTGSLLWLEENGLHIHVNKCDLWQDAPSGVTWDDSCYCSGHEEELTCVKHAGEITLKMGFPVFNYLYQKAFTARLALADAAAYIENDTPFGSFRLRAFAHNGVNVLTCVLNCVEPESPEITLSRFGSRTLWRWYCQQKFTPETGLEGTNATAEDTSLYITQSLEPTKFCIGLRYISDDTPAEARLRNSRSARLIPDASESYDFTIIWSVKTADTVEEALTACKSALDSAQSLGEEAIFESHKKEWHDFWDKSYIAIPDDYLENIWYLYLYYMNSESRGAYPPHFTSGLWGFNHDYVPWNYYFHYNLQHMYLPLDAAGHPELAKNYFNLRRNGMEKCRLYAKIVKRTGGIFLHDVTDRFGRGAEYHYMNCAPGSQVAMQCWRHWLFSGDEEFLNNTALPFMRESVLFYLDMLTPGDDGMYHIHATSAYESNEVLDDSCTDLTMIRTLFPVYLPFAETALRERIEDALSHLPPPLYLPMSVPVDWDGETISYGIGKGKKPLGDAMIFGVGYKDGQPVRKSFGDPEVPEQIEAFPDVELSPLYPAGITGMGDRGSPMYNALMNQLLLHRTGDETGHWNMLPVYLARMGLGSDVYKAAREMLSNFQGFPNGLNAEDGEPGTLVRNEPAFYTVRNTETEEKQLLRSDDFIHFDFETEPIIAMAIQETLLQSHEGFIRLCPAADGLPVAFRLYAQGGFDVSAEFTENGFIVTVESLLGSPCYILLPEFTARYSLYAYKSRNGEDYLSETVNYSEIKNETVIDFSFLKKGETVLLSGEPLSGLEIISEPPHSPNAAMKICGKAVLGSPALIG